MYFRIIIFCIVLFTLGCTSSENDSQEGKSHSPDSMSLLRPREAALERNYHIEEVAFLSADGTIQLAGELTKPFGNGPFPAVVLITGSGPQDRNEAIAGHRPFLILSDYLVQTGCAVLRYDDRGVGLSTGNFDSASVPDFAIDASNAMRWLQKQDFVDKSRTGYIGHSEGGIVAPLAAQKVNATFLVLLAAPVLPVGEILVLREKLNAKLKGDSQEKTSQEINLLNTLFTSLLHSNSREEAFHSAKEKLLANDVPEEKAMGWVKAFTSPGLYWIAKYDPSPTLEAFEGPVLAIYASEDTKIIPAENAAKVKALTKNTASKIVVAQGLNHLFQPVEPNTISKYENSEISFDDSVLEIIGNWISQEFLN